VPACWGVALLQDREVVVHALDIVDDVLLVGAGDGAELQILFHRHGRESAAALRHMRDAETDDVFGRAAGERLALEFDRARVERTMLQIARRVGGLAGAVGPEQGWSGCLR